jgi:hypothetical protein
MFDALIKELTDSYGAKWDGQQLSFEYDRTGEGEPDEWVFDIKPLQLGDTLLVAVDGYVLLPDPQYVRSHIDRYCQDLW